MMSLTLKSGDRVPVAMVATGTTLGAQVQSQVASTGREVSYVCVFLQNCCSFGGKLYAAASKIRQLLLFLEFALCVL